MKTFKNSYMAAESSMEIEPSISGELFHITHVTGRGEKSFKFSNTDAPALALAILEAAGGTETDSPYMHEAADNLRAYILIEEKVSAEAKEQAELEAEALELYNARISFLGGEALTSFEKLNQDNKDMWLAVARKAREMRAEK